MHGPCARAIAPAFPAACDVFGPHRSPTHDGDYLTPRITTITSIATARHFPHTPERAPKTSSSVRLLGAYVSAPVMMTSCKPFVVHTPQMRKQGTHG
jgi:hypothetical protein